MVSLMIQLYIPGGDVFFLRGSIYFFCFFLGFCLREMRNDILGTNRGSKCDRLRNEKQKKKGEGGRRGNFFFFYFRGL